MIFLCIPTLKSTCDESQVASDQQDAIITDLDLRSTRRDQNTDDAATEKREQAINDVDLRSARLQQDTNSDESEQMAEQPDENMDDTDLRSNRPQSTTESEIDENTSKSPSEAGDPDLLNSRGKDIIVPDLSDNQSRVNYLIYLNGILVLKTPYKVTFYLTSHRAGDMKMSLLLWMSSQDTCSPIL